MPPFLIAIILAYVANPGVTYLENRGVKRVITIGLFTVLVILFIAVFTAVLWPIIRDQAVRFSQLLPGYTGRASEWAASFLQIEVVPPETSLPTDTSTATSENSPATNAADDKSPEGQSAGKSPTDNLIELAKTTLPESGAAVTTTVNVIQKSFSAIISFFSTIFLIPVIGFYLLRDWNQIFEKLMGFVPEKYTERVERLTTDVNSVLGHFLRGQLVVMIALTVMYSAGLLFAGIDFAILIAVVSGLLSFVPFLGTAIGLIMGMISVASQSASWLSVGLVLLVFGVGQFMEGNFLTPRLVGDKVGLHPVVVIFALAAGAQLFGFVGLLFALPAAAVIWVVIRHFYHQPIEM